MAEIMYAALDLAFRISDLTPHFSARVFVLQFRQLFQQRACALVARVGRYQRDLDDLVAALAGAPRVRHPLFAKAELLAVDRALGNLQHGAAVDGRYLDLGAEGGFGNGDGDGDFDIVAFAAEECVRFHLRRDIEIAGRRAMVPALPLPGTRRR